MTRVYVPLTLAQLRRLVEQRALPGPLPAHAVTEALREEWPEGDDEQWEYAALMAAADDSLAARPADEPARRLVAAADVSRVDPGAGTRVDLPDGLTWRGLAAVLADAADLAPDVAGDAEAAAEVDLGWFATQEVETLL